MPKVAAQITAFLSKNTVDGYNFRYDIKNSLPSTSVLDGGSSLHRRNNAFFNFVCVIAFTFTHSSVVMKKLLKLFSTVPWMGTDFYGVEWLKSWTRKNLNLCLAICGKLFHCEHIFGSIKIKGMLRTFASDKRNCCQGHDTHSRATLNAKAEIFVFTWRKYWCTKDEVLVLSSRIFPQTIEILLTLAHDLLFQRLLYGFALCFHEPSTNLSTLHSGVLRQSAPLFIIINNSMTAIQLSANNESNKKFLAVSSKAKIHHEGGEDWERPSIKNNCCMDYMKLRFSRSQAPLPSS